jgi:hypothetical protein
MSFVQRTCREFTGGSQSLAALPDFSGSLQRKRGVLVALSCAFSNQPLFFRREIMQRREPRLFPKLVIVNPPIKTTHASDGISAMDDPPVLLNPKAHGTMILP